MKLRVVAYEGDSYRGSYSSWQDRLAYPFRRERIGQLAFKDQEDIERFWDEFYQEEFSRQLHIEAEPSTPIQNLIDDLANQFGVAAPQSEDEGIDVWGFGIPSGGQKGQSSHCYLVQIPSGRRLDPKLTLGDEMIQDGDLLGFTSVYPAWCEALMVPVPSSADLFAVILSADGRPPQYTDPHAARYTNYRLALEALRTESPVPEPLRSVSRVWGALLYTDEDGDLATYVRKHFASLSAMSGEKLHIFVIEEPEHNERLAAKYWKALLQEKLFIIWSTMGWLSSKPYDKSQTYEIGRKLGVYPDQLPCLVLFDELERMEKLVFPIFATSATFFRSLFSALERSLETESMPGASYEAIRKQYTSILDTLKNTAPVVSAYDRTQYNFYGQTVFVNHPQGSLTLSDFQKQ